VAVTGGYWTLLAGTPPHRRTGGGRSLDTTTPQRVSHCCFAKNTARIIIIRIILLVPMTAITMTPGNYTCQERQPLSGMIKIRTK
jgi:hypothetical protein